MKKGTIDLDWLEADIAEYKRVLSERDVVNELDSIYNHILNTLMLVRSKCTPIKEVKQVTVDSQGGMDFVFTELPQTCIQEWESAKYCQNENKCQMCETIKQ